MGTKLSGSKPQTAFVCVCVCVCRDRKTDFTIPIQIQNKLEKTAHTMSEA